MKYCRFIAGVFIFLLPVGAVRSQTSRIEALKKELRSATGKSEQLQALLLLCDQGYTLHPDTLMHYAQVAQKIATGLGDVAGKAYAQYYQSYALTTKGLIDSSLQLADACLALANDSLDDPLLTGKLMNQRGRCYMRKNQYRQAIEMGYAVIEEAEKGKDVLLQMKGKTLLGWAYLELGQSQEALQWHLKALHTTTDTLIWKQYGILFANLALNYNALGKMDSAFYYIDQAVRYSREAENLFALSNSLAIQAQLFIASGQRDRARQPLEETVQIRKLIGDPFYIVSDMSQLAFYYAENGEPEKGIELCREGLAMARRYQLHTKLFFLYSALAANYKVQGDMTAYAGTLEKIITLKDSIFKANSAEALAALQAKYELEKKENTIMQQRFDLVRKNYLLYGSLIILTLIVILSVLLFREYRRRNQIKLEKMLEDEKRAAAGAVKQAEEKERQRIAADLHDNLGAYAASMASNLDYIKMTGLPEGAEEAYRELQNNAQAITAQLNDTIWVLKKEALSLTAISDRIKVFINRIQPSYPQVRIDVDESIDNDLALPASQAFHLYCIAQEAINNALKHSAANRVLVKITSNASWTISIADNGRGMPAGPVNRGNGLQNMTHRSAESGWTVEWVANEQGGTTVVVIGQ